MSFLVGGKMKKIGKLLIYGIILITVLQVILFFIKNGHKVSYQIVNNKTEFKIDETLKENRYILSITTKDKIFIYDIPNEMNKQKEIVKDIIFDVKDGEMCIYPVLEKDLSEIKCSKNNDVYSASLAMMDLTNLKNLVNKNSKVIKNSNSKFQKEGSLEVYYKNIDEDEIYYIWNYDGFYQLTNKTTSSIKLLTNDNYYNELGVQVDNLYLFFSADEKHHYTSFTIINLENFKKKQVKLKNGISKDSYIQGIVDKKIYLFDPDNLKQYEIDLKKKLYKVIGDKKKNAKDYQNGKWRNRNIYDFKNEKREFDLTYPLSDDEKMQVKEMKQENNTIYYLMKNGEVNSYHIPTKKMIKLTKNKNISTLVIANEKFCYLEEDMLYCEKNKEKYPIVHYEEFLFNSLSRVFIAKE